MDKKLSNKLLKKETTDIRLKVLYADRTNYDIDRNQRIHFHPFTEFYYITKGSGIFTIENKLIKVKEKDFLIINSNIGHTEQPEKNVKDFEYISFGVEGITITCEADERGESESNFIIKTLRPIDYKIKEYFELILKAFEKKDKYSASYANSYATILMIDLLRSYNREIIISNERKIDRQIDYIKNYMDDKYAEDIRLEDLANMAYMNKFHLINEFKNAYGVTPIEYLILKRIDITKNYLITTNHSMEEISSMVGFNSQSYFNQVFRKKVGCTPSQYRKSHRLNNNI